MEDENDKTKLKKDSVISQETGIPLKLCRKYREILKTKLVYGKTPAIYAKQGCTKANFFKKDIKQIIYSYANLY
jgi:hypothetical protein